MKLNTIAWSTAGLLAVTAFATALGRDDWLREAPPLRAPIAPPAPLPPPKLPAPMPVLTVDEAMAFIAPMEGRKARIYKDSRMIPSIGVGFNLRRKALAQARLNALGVSYKAILTGRATLTEDQIDTLFAWDVTDAMRAAERLCPGFWVMPMKAQAVVVDMVFNLGPTGFSEFVAVRQLLAAGRWREAAQQLLRSAYARQIPDRARRNAEALLSIA